MLLGTGTGVSVRSGDRCFDNILSNLLLILVLSCEIKIKRRTSFLQTGCDTYILWSYDFVMLRLRVRAKGKIQQPKPDGTTSFPLVSTRAPAHTCTPLLEETLRTPCSRFRLLAATMITEGDAFHLCMLRISQKKICRFVSRLTAMQHCSCALFSVDRVPSFARRGFAILTVLHAGMAWSRPGSK